MSVIVGFLIGMIMSLSYEKEEIRFLYIQTHSVRMISIYQFFRMLIPILGVCVLLFVTLLIHNNNFLKFTALYIKLFFGYFLGIYFLYLFQMNKKNMLIFFPASLFIMIPSLMEGNLVLQLVTGALFFYPFFQLSNHYWYQSLHKPVYNKGKRKRVLFSINPIMKKEFILLFGFQRLFPLTILFLIGQIFSYVTTDLPFDGYMYITIILFIIMNDTWTLNIVGLENQTINLYASSHTLKRRLIVTKWVICFSLISLIGGINYLLWALFSANQSENLIKNLLSILLLNFSISIWFMMLGVCFSDFRRVTYYRINIIGIILSVVGLIVLIFSYFIFFPLFIIETSLLCMMLIRILNSKEKLRSYLYGL